MPRAGLISLALCSVLLIAACNCATFSNEIEAELRDLHQAETFEENGAIELNNNVEEREGM